MSGVAFCFSFLICSSRNLVLRPVAGSGKRHRRLSRNPTVASRPDAARRVPQKQTLALRLTTQLRVTSEII